MQRHARRVFRIARAIVVDDDHAEQTLRDVYLEAYAHLWSFAGRSSFSTWLTKIAIDTAVTRRRRGARASGVWSRARHASEPPPPDPGKRATRPALAKYFEAAIDRLPTAFRIVLVLHNVEDLSIEETAAALDIPEDTVRVGLVRARALLQHELEASANLAIHDIFPFDREREDRLVASVLERLANEWRLDWAPAIRSMRSRARMAHGARRA